GLRVASFTIWKQCRAFSLREALLSCTPVISFSFETFVTVQISTSNCPKYSPRFINVIRANRSTQACSAIVFQCISKLFCNDGDSTAVSNAGLARFGCFHYLGRWVRRSGATSRHLFPNRPGKHTRAGWHHSRKRRRRFAGSYE